MDYFVRQELGDERTGEIYGMYLCMISHEFKQRSPYNFEQIEIWYVCRDRTIMAPTQGHTYHLVRIIISFPQQTGKIGPFHNKEIFCKIL